MKLAGKVAIITGGGRGIGLGIARRFTAEGARVIIAQRHLEDAEAAAAGTAMIARPLDVTDPARCAALVDFALERFGRLDVLVNNAGVAGLNGSLIDLDHCVWRQVIETNLSGTFYCGQAAARAMIRCGARGRILNIGSVNSFCAQKNAAAYVASKGGVLMLTKAMAVDLAPYGIRVNCLAPGSILVERNRVALTAQASLGQAIPLGAPGSVEDVAAAAAFLASDESAFITGAALVIDGGFLSYARME